jgi:hypothetical protein
MAAPPAQWNILSCRGVFVEASWPILLVSTHSTSVSSQWEMRAVAQNEMAPRPILWVGCPLFPPAPFPQILPKSQTSSTVHLNPRHPITLCSSRASHCRCHRACCLSTGHSSPNQRAQYFGRLWGKRCGLSISRLVRSISIKTGYDRLPILWPISDAATN